MAIASFRYGLKSSLPSSFSDGAIYITTDTGELFFGNESSGVKISDFVAVATYEDLPAAPLSNKFYYVTGDAVIYKYQNGEWTPIGGGGGGGTVNAGVGLAKSGTTIKAKLLSETALNNAAAAATEVSGRVYPISIDSVGYLAVNVPWVNTEYESKSAVENGTDLSLVTTGEKYAWNHKTSTNGTVTSIAASDGLITASGAAVTDSGTIKPNLKSFTALSTESAVGTEVSGRVYSVVKDNSGYLAVSVPWEDTTYQSKTAVSAGTDVSLCTTGEKYAWDNKIDSAGTGLSVDGTALKHTNSVTAGTAQGSSGQLTNGGTFSIPTLTYDAQGHITANGTTTCTLPSISSTGGTWTTTESAAVGATSVAFTNPLNSASVTVDPYCENAGGTNGGTAPVAPTEVVATAATITLYFDALTVATDFKCIVY